MATVILRGALTYHVAGLAFKKGVPTVVDDALAKTLEGLIDASEGTDGIEYYDVTYDGTKPGDKPKAGGVKIKAQAAPAGAVEI